MGSLRKQSPKLSPVCPSPCSHSHAQIRRTSTLQSNPNRNKPGNDRSVSFRPTGSASYSRDPVSCRSTRNVRPLHLFSSHQPRKWFYGRSPTLSFFFLFSFLASFLARYEEDGCKHALPLFHSLPGGYQSGLLFSRNSSLTHRPNVSSFHHRYYVRVHTPIVVPRVWQPSLGIPTRLEAVPTRVVG